MLHDKAWIGTMSGMPSDVAVTLDRGFSGLGCPSRAGQRWVVKLNLTYPTYLPGVVNSPVFIEGLCRWASDNRLRLQFVEGDGGNASYTAWDTFAGNGVAELARRHGMSCVSLSEGEWTWRETVVAGTTVRLPYSRFFEVKDYDRFVSAPVFKNHVFTIVSLGMKNLWGCIPDPYRMYYHHVLDEGIVALCKELQPDLSIFDGIVGLRGRGPMDGHPVSMNAIMVASTIGAGEAAALEVMGVRLSEVRHLQIAHSEGVMPLPGAVDWRSDPQSFCRTDFVVERSWLNRVSIAVSRFPRLQRLVYHSAMSSSLYRVANRLREDSPQVRLSKATPRRILRGVRGDKR